MIGEQKLLNGLVICLFQLWLLDSNVQMFRSDLRLKNDVTQSEISTHGVTQHGVTKNGVIKNGVTQPEVKQTATSKVLFKCQLGCLSDKR